MKYLTLRRLVALLSVTACLSLSAQTPAAAPARAPAVHATDSVEKTDANGKPNVKFQRLHQMFLERGKSPIDVLFLGDSITEGWLKAPHVWDHYYGLLRPANFGIGGDRTEHVIWRINNGEFDGISPKVVVLMLGTNNSAANPAEEIAAADKKIVEMIRTKCPKTKVLVLAIFPRGARKDRSGNIPEANVVAAAKQMEVINAVNAELAKLDDGQNVRFLSINDRFVGQDGKIPFAIMPDQLHPNAAGYELWAEAMQPLLQQMLK